MQTFTTTLLEKKELTKNVYALTFTKPEDFEFFAGQFIQFLIPQDEKAIPRAYSLCSSAQEKDLLFCVKYLENGVASEYFDQMNVGDNLKMRGPRGNFYIKGDVQTVELIATGTGIAPMMGILREELLYKKNPAHFHLLFGVRHEEDLFWQKEFQQLAEQQDNFTVDFTLSQPKSKKWPGLMGRVTGHVKPKPDTHYFLCGSAPMVKDVRTLLLEAGVEKTMVHFEIF